MLYNQFLGLAAASCRKNTGAIIGLIKKMYTEHFSVSAFVGGVESNPLAHAVSGTWYVTSGPFGRKVLLQCSA